ncbi:MAG: hypothetical protein ACRDFB_02365, partial [Rhabdochlamydiaceae bacterium]
TTVTQTFELEKSIIAIKGLLLTSDRDDLLYANGSQRIEINGEEIFPEGYESKLLMSGVNVQPNKRYFDLGNMLPGNGRVKIEYTDTNPNALPAPPPGPGTNSIPQNYRVSLYLECEMQE